jgi:predicted GTPase
MDIHAQTRTTINVAILGAVSAGKSTFANALFTHQFSDCHIKRTTALPQLYHELTSAEIKGMNATKHTEEKLQWQKSDIKAIREKNREANTKIMDATAKGEKLDLSNIKPVEYTVPKINGFTNLKSDKKGNDVVLTIWDMPGLNDAETKDVYFKYAKDNFHSWDIVIFMVDINSALNTSSEVEILDLILGGINSNKSLDINTQLLVLVNKCDDITIDANGVSTPTDEEFKEMYTQIQTIVSAHAKKSKHMFVADAEAKSAEANKAAKAKAAEANKAAVAKALANKAAKAKAAKANKAAVAKALADKATDTDVNKANKADADANKADADANEAAKAAAVANKAATAVVNNIDVDDYYNKPAVVNASHNDDIQYVCASCEDAFIYRMVKQELFDELDNKYISKLGSNEFGKNAWKRMSETKQREKVKKLLADEETLHNSIKMCGWAYLTTVINNMLTVDNQYSYIMNRVNDQLKVVRNPNKNDIYDDILWFQLTELHLLSVNNLFNIDSNLNMDKFKKCLNIFMSYHNTYVANLIEYNNNPVKTENKAYTDKDIVEYRLSLSHKLVDYDTLLKMKDTLLAGAMHVLKKSSFANEIIDRILTYMNESSINKLKNVNLTSNEIVEIIVCMIESGADFEKDSNKLSLSVDSELHKVYTYKYFNHNINNLCTLFTALTSLDLKWYSSKLLIRCMFVNLYKFWSTCDKNKIDNWALCISTITGFGKYNIRYDNPHYIIIKYLSTTFEICMSDYVDNDYHDYFWNYNSNKGCANECIVDLLMELMLKEYPESVKLAY